MTARSPFSAADAALADLGDRADAILVDMHGEATSEKVAMGWHLDGRVTACVGTHTHVPTADARVLPGGTAYITDVGMTGPRGGVIGVKRELALERFLAFTNVRFETSDEDPWLNALLVEADGEGRATVACCISSASASSSSSCRRSCSARTLRTITASSARFLTATSAMASGSRSTTSK